MPGFSVVVAATQPCMGIGKAGGLPWKRLKPDMQYFKQLTTTAAPGKQNAVIMGRKTWESIPDRFRPLSDRINVVLTRNPNYALEEKGVTVFSSFNAALDGLKGRSDLDQIYVIGGSQVYKEALSHNELSEVFLTKVYKDFDCDTFLPIDMSAFKSTSSGEQEIWEDIPYEFCTLRPNQANFAASAAADCVDAPRHEEYQYLDMIRECIEKGVERGDRTGTGTLSTFGRTMRYSLRGDTFPLLTTKKTFWRGVAEELIWFVKGCTNAKELAAKKVRIWDGNGSKEFLESRGLGHREEGDLGPVYGFQWRHFGAEYKDMHADYAGQGVDQLKNVIDLIKNNPTSRRIVMTAWNPKDQPLMALPPCHMFCQFYVANGELSCQMYQRSADMGLGVPFNIASYSLLTRMIAQVCGLKAGEFIHVIGDCHVYKNHVEPLKKQLEREPRPFPKLKINPDVKDIDGFQYSDFEITDYKPYPAIKMKMAV